MFIRSSFRKRQMIGECLLGLLLVRTTIGNSLLRKPHFFLYQDQSSLPITKNVLILSHAPILALNVSLERFYHLIINHGDACDLAHEFSTQALKYTTVAGGPKHFNYMKKM